MDAAKSFVLDAQGQEDLLKEALRNAQDQAFRMKRSMDTGELNGVLKHAAELLRELRTSLLSPKNYYQLYMQVLDELRHLASYVEDLHKTGTSIRTLYERVQSSGNVLPRLYLLVTVGSVYIKANEAPAREVLTDLVEMTKGVQHPLRGLFLRHYLSVCVKDVLPDVGTSFEGDGGSVDDAIAFLLTNLRETNRLWIRMQTQRAGTKSSGTNATSDRSARETERQDLRLLVGTSLVRLSQLDGVTLAVYGARVLPPILTIVGSCKDRIAQQYLLDCVIHVFPDDFHLTHLDQLLAAIPQLVGSVDAAAIVLALLERLTKYHAGTNADTNRHFGATTATIDSMRAQQLERFELVLNCVTQLTARSGTSSSSDTSASAASVASTLALFAGFTAFTLASIDDCSSSSSDSDDMRTDCVRRVLESCVAFAHAQHIGTSAGTSAGISDTDTVETAAVVQSHVSEVLLAVMRALSVTALMQIDAVRDLLLLLPWKTSRKRVVLTFVHVLLTRAVPISSVSQTEFVLDVLAPLIRDDPNDPPLSLEPTGADRDAFEREQAALARLVHLVRCPNDLDVQFQMFGIARRAFGHGGVFRIRFTLVPLIFESLALARALATAGTNNNGANAGTNTSSNAGTNSGTNADTTTGISTGSTHSDTNNVSAPATLPREVLQFAHEMVTALASKLEQMSVTCVNLYLQCALVADASAFEAIAYEFVTQAFIVYEDQISHSRDQWRALELLVASLCATRHLTSANYEVLATKTTQHAAKLLKKHEQAAMVLHCAHLFWHPCLHDGKRVLECLQRSLRIADACSGSSSSQVVPLFIEILEAYLFFYEAKTPEVTPNYVSGLLALVKDHLENMEHGPTRSECEVRVRDIRRYMDTLAAAATAAAPGALVASAGSS